MTDEYKAQISTTINGSLVNLRGQTIGEVAGLAGDLAAQSGDIFRHLGDVAQVALATGVLTGPTGGQQTSRAVQGPPGPEPSCPTHGTMKDMAGKRNKAGQPLKNRFYCVKFGCEDTKPQGEWYE